MSLSESAVEWPLIQRFIFTCDAVANMLMYQIFQVLHTTTCLGVSVLLAIGDYYRFGCFHLENAPWWRIWWDV